MGLLDVFLKGTGDPERDAAINSGLLNAGLALMQARGRLFPALGQAGQAGVQAMQQTRQQQEARKRAGLQDQLLKNQLASQQREQEMAALPGQFYRAPSQPGVDATGGMETAVEAPNNASSPEAKFDMQGYIQTLMAKSPMQGLQMQAALAKDETPLTVAKDAVLLDRRTKQPIFSNAQPDKPDRDKEIERLKLIYGDGTPAYQAALQRYGQKMTSHQPATTVHVGAERALAAGLGKQAAEAVDKSASEAQAAQGTQAIIGNIRSAMSKGSVILGPGAQYRQGALRVGQIVGAGSKGSADELARTKEVEQGLAGLELEAAALMRGQGQITESERVIIRKAAAGQIQDLTPKELEVAMGAIERNAVRKIKSHEQRIKQLPEGAAPGMRDLLSPAPASASGAVNWGDLK